MLAKQFWRLLTNRNSLAHRIFQARYFPGATILDAKLGYRPSLVWRSIFSAKPLILTGLRYRVGSGFNIRIGLDPWIPRPSTFRPITVLPPHLAAASVSALIDHHTNDWCRECIETNFLPEDHDVILSIPLGRGIHEDIPIWHFTESGQFTVKSAYYLEISRSTDATSSVQAGSPSWNFFWSTKIPRRIQVFAWRACLNALPTSANLGHRIRSSLNACPYCETEMEDSLHALWDCHFARQVWLLSNLGWTTLCRNTSDVESWMRGIAKYLNSKDFGLFLTIAWSIWQARNRRIAENSASSPMDIICSAHSFLSAYEGVCSQTIQLLHPRRPASWEPPPSGTVKVNFDGACLEGDKAGGVGVIARNSAGQCLAWCAFRIDKPVKPLVIEATAVREAARLVAQQG
ncbi:UNVERIFIED_CONTAM: hypothetical protein Sradi_1996600 [Sesamum radiatum]|uniref:Reverse transcriptase zinc-binding domain-containing protein n=1 Tax=Sesamum radiatum TaxID=300843 RepID=A0AAW2TF80_SESRA